MQNYKNIIWLLLVMLGTITEINATSSVGPYIGLDAGYAGVQNYSSGQFGLNFNAGYAFNKYIAAEGDYLYITPQSQCSGYLCASANDSFLLAAIRGTIAINNKIDLFGKAGFGFNFASTSSSYPGWFSTSTSYTNPAMMIGGGISFDLNSNVSIKAEDLILFTSSSNSFGNVNVLGAGIEYKF